MATHKQGNTMNTVIKITLHWSENSEINRRFKAIKGNIELEITLNAFTLACKAASLSAPKQGEGYDKTKFTVHFTDGDVATLRLDLTQNEYNPKALIQEYLDWKASKS
jgi:hypothetical protein